MKRRDPRQDDGLYRVQIEYQGRLMRVSVIAKSATECIETLEREYPGYKGVVDRNAR